MKRGFTIIELLVVVTVIGILVGITMMSFTNYQNRASDNQARTMINAINAGAERYYTANNEYPLASTLFGGTPTGSAPASYATAASTLGISADILNASRVQFVPCSGTCTISDPSKVYYLTKTDTDGATQRQYTVTSCTYTLIASENGALSYIILYFSKQNNYWMAVKSSRGSPYTANTSTCPFTTS